MAQCCLKWREYNFFPIRLYNMYVHIILCTQPLCNCVLQKCREGVANKRAVCVVVILGNDFPRNGFYSERIKVKIIGIFVPFFGNWSKFLLFTWWWGGGGGSIIQNVWKYLQNIRQNDSFLHTLWNEYINHLYILIFHYLFAIIFWFHEFFSEEK